MTTTETLPKEDYLDKVSKQKIGYKELDKFVPGEAGLQYFPVPVEEYNSWKKEQDRKSLEEWEKKQKDKQAILELRTEEPRSNGHNEITIEIPIEKDGKEIARSTITKSITWPKLTNPNLCDLKKKYSNKKRVSKKK